MRKDRFGFKGSYITIWNKKVSIIWIILTGFVMYFIYVSTGKTVENNQLGKSGIETSAVVTDVRKVGSKGIIRCTYLFEVNNDFYTGSVDDDFYKAGDSIRILYLNKNPEINRDKKFINQN